MTNIKAVKKKKSKTEKYDNDWYFANKGKLFHATVDVRTEKLQGITIESEKTLHMFLGTNGKYEEIPSREDTNYYSRAFDSTEVYAHYFSNELKKAIYEAHKLAEGYYK